MRAEKGRNTMGLVVSAIFSLSITLTLHKYGCSPKTLIGLGGPSKFSRKSMAALDNLFGTHTANLSQALGRASARQGLLMNNLANVNVPGYKRQDLDFDIVLKTELGDRRLGVEGARARMNPSKSNEASQRLDGNSVDLEREVMNIAETQVRYQMLTQITNRYFSGLKSVIREGK